MSDHAMLGENELQQVGNYVKQNLRGWMDEVLPDRQAISTRLLERMVRMVRIEEHSSRMEHHMIRVEEELKAQRDLMEVKFNAVDQRFEAVDQRFESLIETMNGRFASVDRRFEAVDKRFALLQWVMGVGFVMIGTLVTVFGVLA